MQIAVLSGKGGAGKTFVSVNLAAVAPRATYIDCDVEAPNGHLFFKPQVDKTAPVKVPIPRLNAALCDACNRCVEFCKFNALALVGDELLVFDDICHSCDGCLLVCPQNALSETAKEIGTIQEGSTRSVTVRSGFMHPGIASGTPIIDELLNEDTPRHALTIIDCPPGTACPVIDSIEKADYCVIVAEPTLFGLHNLQMVEELVTVFKKPHGVVVNKITDEDNLIAAYCKDNNLPLLAQFPMDKELGEQLSDGAVAAHTLPRYKAKFETLLETVLQKQGEKQ